jgi:predicted metal-binding membrane protein
VIAAAEEVAARGGLAPALAAVRVRVALVVVLVVAAGLCWWLTYDGMRGMDDGPWSALGTLSWFVGVWVAMMAAMMLPSVAPTVALYSRMTRSRSPAAPLAFAAGYLLAWASIGVLSFAIAAAGGRVADGVFDWHRAGRWLAAATLVGAAVYEVTPLKNVCLGKCRSPLGFLLGAWRDGPQGGLVMGIRHGAWCIGCCWALMASLFALGVMSLAWSALIAALIAFEKLIPSRRLATSGTAALLLALGVLVAVAPGAIPGLAVPGSGSMSQMP